MGFSFSGAVSGAVTGFTVGGLWGAVGGAVIGGVAGGKADDASKKAERVAADEASRQQVMAKEYFDPYAQAGEGALARMQQLLGLEVTANKGPPKKVFRRDMETDDWINKRQQELIATGEAKYSGGEGAAQARTDAGYEASAANAGKTVRPWETQMPDEVAAPTAPGSQGSSPQSIAQMFEQTPGYAYTRNQSEEAIRREAARTGRAYDPSMLLELQKNSAGLASNTFDSYMDRLAGLTDAGRIAASSLVGASAEAGRYGTGAQIAGIAGRSDRDQKNWGTALGGLTTKTSDAPKTTSIMV